MLAAAEDYLIKLGLEHLFWTAAPWKWWAPAIIGSHSSYPLI